MDKSHTRHNHSHSRHTATENGSPWNPHPWPSTTSSWAYHGYGNTTPTFASERRRSPFAGVRQLAISLHGLRQPLSKHGRTSKAYRQSTTTSTSSSANMKR